MKKAKEAAQEVMALLPLTDSSAPDSVASREAAVAATGVYRQELLESLSTRQDTKRGLLGQGALVRELDAAWKGFAHRLAIHAPDLFGSDDFKGSFETLARGTISKDVASVVWTLPPGPKARAEQAKADAAARKGKGGKDNRGNRSDKRRDSEKNDGNKGVGQRKVSQNTADRNRGARPAGSPVSAAK